jgi:hypothetical protein
VKRRNWTFARAKVSKEGFCRKCGTSNGVQAAHILGRAYDNGVVVLPCAIVPLCPSCHRQYDDHELDLWPYLTTIERRRAIHRLGEGDARRRISGRAFLDQPPLSDLGHRP